MSVADFFTRDALALAGLASGVRERWHAVLRRARRIAAELALLVALGSSRRGCEAPADRAVMVSLRAEQRARAADLRWWGAQSVRSVRRQADSER